MEPNGTRFDKGASYNQKRRRCAFLKEGEKKEYNEKFYTACRRFLRIGLSAKMIPKVMKAAAAMMNVEMDSVPSRGTVEKAQGQLAVLLCDQVATSLNENAATPGRFQATSRMVGATVLLIQCETKMHSFIQMFLHAVHSSQ